MDFLIFHSYTLPYSWHPRNVGVFYFQVDILMINWRSPKRADVGSSPTASVNYAERS